VARRRALHGVLVTYRRPAGLARSLAALAAQRRRLDLLVVVDNAPGPEGEAAVRRAEAARRVEYVAAPENLGFAGGVALGTERVLTVAADEDWVAVFDDDDPVDDPALLADLLAFAERALALDPATGAVGCVGGRFDLRRGRIVRVPDEELAGAVPCDFVAGGHVPLYRAGALRRAGSFSPAIFFGLSEVEHGLRLRRAGYTVYADGDRWRARRAAAGRLGRRGAPSWRLPPLDWRRYYSLRNAIAILRTWGRPAAAARVTAVQAIGKPLVNLPFAPRAALAHLALGARACFDGWTGRMGRRLAPDGASRPSKAAS
jgi:glycosyltransferase involved in cell wall biosynthesis